MLAKFQGIIFHAEKVEDLPAYALSKGKKHFGTIFLDSLRFIQTVSLGKQFSEGESLAFDIKVEDFQLLDYEIVNREWLVEIMEKKNLSVKEVSEATNTNLATVYRWISGEVEIQGSAKSSLFNLLTK